MLPLHSRLCLCREQDDYNVVPTEIERFEKEISRDSVNYYVFDGLNHHFTNSTEAMVTQEVTDSLSNWINRHCAKIPTAIAETFTNEKFFDVFSDKKENAIVIQLHPYTTTKTQMQVLNSSGQVINNYLPEMTTQQPYIVLKNLPAGMYFVRGIKEGKVQVEKAFFN